MRQRRRMVFSFGVLALIAIAASCREPTQITLHITTGEKCSDLTGVQIIVGPSAAVTQSRFTQRYAAAVTHSCTPDGAGNLIGTLVVTPGASSGTVVVSAGVSTSGTPGPDPAACADLVSAKQCIIARRSFSFIDHASLDLPIDLDPLCVGKVCDPASTCFRGSCVDDTVTCTSSGCALQGETDAGSGSGTDASSSDGAYDMDSGEMSDAKISTLDGSTGHDASDASDVSDSSDSGDSSDGSLSMQSDGGIPPCDVPASCSPSKGRGVVTPGMTCMGAANPMVGCCHCTCPNIGTLTSCDLPMGSSSCAPTMPACP